MAPVKIAKQAIEIAKDFLDAAGLGFNVVIKTSEKNGFWLVEARTMMGSYQLKIDKISGDVAEYGEIK